MKETQMHLILERGKSFTRFSIKLFSLSVRLELCLEKEVYTLLLMPKICIKARTVFCEILMPSLRSSAVILGEP